MPRNKDLKRLVRARMRKTGEAFTTARAQVTRKPTDNGKPAAPPPPDYAALAGMSDAAIRSKTGHDWQGWTRLLDGEDAARLPHRDIARMLHETFAVGDWWAQTVAVGYERIKGLRAIGQRRDGTYEASKSRTFAVPVAALYAAWATPKARKAWLDEGGVSVRTSNAPKTMRLSWPDGSIVVVGFTPKGAGKSSVAVQHTRLPNRPSADAFRAYWSERLDALAVALGT